MKNVNLEVNDDILTITVNLKENYGPSKSGKTNIVATTEGNATIPGYENMKLGLNLFEKAGNGL